MKTIKTFYRDGTDQPLTDEQAVTIVEAYYEQSGGKPWLRKTAGGAA